MFIDIDYNKKMKDYKIELSKPNKTIITNLSERIGAKLNVSLGSLGELTFQIPYKIENEYHEIIHNPNISLLKEKMYLRLTIGYQKMWFIVDNISDETEDSDMMTVQAFSLPMELKNKKVSETTLTSVNAGMLMDELLVNSTWKKGIVDLELQETYRTLDFSDTTIYDALVEGAETFGAIIIWDEETKTVNFRELSNVSQYKGMSVNSEKFLNSLKRSRDTDEMVTRLYVYGNERISIQNVNPSGLKYIEDFSYFLEPFTRDENKNVLTHSNYMSDELCHAILDNAELKEQVLPQINTLQSEISILNSSLATRDIELNEIKLSLATAKGLLDIAKATGDTALITQRQQEVLALENSLSAKQVEIDGVNSQISTKTNQMISLQNSVSITSFTQELLDELDVYIIEKDFSDDRYIDELELYNAGISKFAEMRNPKIVVEISIDSLLNVVEEQYYWDKIVLGDKIHVKYPNMKIDYKSTIVGLDFDLDDMDCTVKIANHTGNLDSMDKLVSIIYDNQSTSLTVSNNKYKWNSIIDVKDRVDQLRDGEIDAVKNRITAGVNESVDIGDNGIILTNPNFPEEMVIMQAGVIALTRDGGDTWNTSITPRGVMAETIIGNLIAGNELVITNSSGTFVMDANGLTIDSDNIFINSGDSQTPENLIDYWNSMSLTMAEFSDDNVINKYEKQQIKKQWDNIVAVHNSMITKFYSEIGTETTENPYPIEYDTYMAKYEALDMYLNSTLQSDNFAILNPLNMDNTTTINPLIYNTKFSEFSKAKDDFQLVIPMEYTRASISILESGINLDYVKNDSVVAKINLSEEGVRIDGKRLTIDTDTYFKHDLVMDAGLIRSVDGAIAIDLNAGTMNLSRPLTINYVEVATTEDLQNIELTPGEKGDSSYLWVRYAQDINGTGFTSSPVDALYVGLATTTTATAPTLYSDYQWSLIKGDKGDAGDELYLWVMYADDINGNGISESSAGKRYLGLSQNNVTVTPSNIPSDYVWSPLYDNVKVGVENMLFKSDIAMSTSNYMVQQYDMTEKMIAGEMYALRLWGALGVGKTHFEACLNGGWISLSDLNDNGDGTYSTIFVGKDSGETTGDYIQIYAKDSAVVVDSTIEKIKLEKGTIHTGYNTAVKDISSMINLKADADSVNTLSENYSEMSKILETKMSKAEYSEFIESYEKFVKGYNDDKLQASSDKSNLTGRTVALEENLGGMSRKWNFVDSSIQIAEEGMLISGVIYDESRDVNAPTGMEILLTNNQISFLDNDTVVAFISGKVLQINHGIFVKSMQVGNHLMHSLASNPKITVFSYVGEE